MRPFSGRVLVRRRGPFNEAATKRKNRRDRLWRGRAMSSAIEGFLDAIDIRAEVCKALAEAIGKQGKATASKALDGMVGQFLVECTGDATSAVLGSLAASLLKALLGVREKTAKELKKLVREPYETGMRVATEALELSVTTPGERAAREKELWFAMGKLQEAQTLLGPEPTAELMYLLFVHGLCASQVDGGGPRARERLALVAKALEEASERALHKATFHADFAKMVEGYPSRAETEAKLKHSEYFINRGPDFPGTHREDASWHLSAKRLHEEGTEYAAIAKVIRAIMSDSDRQTIVVGCEPT